MTFYLSVEERLDSLEKRVKKLEDSMPAIGGILTYNAVSVESLIIKNIRKIETQDLVVIALRLKARQQKSEIKAMLRDWGKSVGNWFQGGNLNTRMVNKGIVKKVESEKRDVIFTLTKKGELEADRLIEKLNR